MGRQQQVEGASRLSLSFPRSSGSSATTIGNIRIELSDTAIAVPINVAPVPSAEIRITCAGAAHTSTVEAAIHQGENP